MEQIKKLISEYNFHMKIYEKGKNIIFWNDVDIKYVYPLKKILKIINKNKFAEFYEKLLLLVAMNIQEKYKKNTLLSVIIPNYNNEVNKPYYEALELVTQGKLKKDVGSKIEEEKEFKEYEDATNKLKDIKEILIDHMPQMTMYVREVERNRLEVEKSTKINKYGLTIGIITGIIGIVSLILTLIICFV